MPATDPGDAGEGNHLGARIAERIEQGLQSDEDVEALFDEVDDMVGGTKESDDVLEKGNLEQEGDLQPLIREYLWEQKKDNHGDPDRVVLEGWIRSQQEQPVPVLDLEMIGETDLNRYLLQCYLQAPAGQRGLRTMAAFASLRGFYTWAMETQHYDLGEVISGAQNRIVEPLDRLERVASLLSATNSVAPEGGPGVVQVEGIEADTVQVSPLGDGDPLRLRLPADQAELLREDLRTGDILLGPLRQDPSTASFVGMVIALPAAAEQLLG